MSEKLNSFFSLFLTQNNLVYILGCAPISFITIFFIMKLICTLMDITITKKQQFLFVITYGISIIFSKFLLPAPYYRLFNLILTPLFMKIFFKTNKTKNILADVLVFLIIVVVDALFSFVYCNIYGIENFEEGIKIPLFNISLISTMAIFFAISYIIVKKSNIHININDNIPKHETNKIIFLSSIGLFILTIELWKTVFFSEDLPLLINLTSIIAIILYTFLSMSNVYKISRITKSDMDIEELQGYNKTLKELNDDVRAFKHDFNNIIQAIGGYVASEDMNGLKNYYNSIYKDCILTNKLELLNPTLINNPAIYNILTHKIEKSKQNNIDFNLHVSLDLSSLDMNIYELTRILGILFDNAIEASKECDEKTINVDFYLDSKKKMQVFKIENTYKEKNIDLDKIFKKSYSTKPGNTGLGLWKVRKIIKKYNNVNLYTTKNNTFFIQQLEIYL